MHISCCCCCCCFNCCCLLHMLLLLLLLLQLLLLMFLQYKLACISEVSDSLKKRFANTWIFEAHKIQKNKFTNGIIIIIYFPSCITKRGVSSDVSKFAPSFLWRNRIEVNERSVLWLQILNSMNSLNYVFFLFLYTQRLDELKINTSVR